MQFWAFFGMLWVCFFRPGVPQDRVIYPTDEDNQLEDGSNTVQGVPERLLLMMKDVDNASEFLKRFVVTQDDAESGELSGSINSRRAFAPAVGMEVAQFAACRPELQVVKLQRGSIPSGVMLWPPCVRVQRCGGCCTSKLLDCRPSAISTVNVTVLQVRISPHRLDAFENEGERVISLEQHDRCACGCRQLPDECIPGLQEYRPAECRCACLNHDQAMECVGEDRLWDSTECSCKCRHPTECSTGFYYSFRACRCEAFRDAVLAAFQPRISNMETLNQTSNSSAFTMP